MLANLLAYYRCDESRKQKNESEPDLEASKRRIVTSKLLKEERQHEILMRLDKIIIIRVILRRKRRP